ncbi:hypothetical protein [Nocardia spumae]|uniref:hypothetical protein n=1 Tax=Nocardia spumae TaxID=2887190 RepID=UPI001D13AA6C|nr:hypothetical protein [Nocardia spumae]
MATEVETAPENAAQLESAPAGAAGAPSGPKRTIAVSVRTLGTASAAIVAIAAVTVFAVLWSSARADLQSMRRAVADDAHAEQVATDYAIGASTINYQDFDGWAAKLKANTTPQLAAKFDATAPKLQEILTPLKWTSSANPLTAKVTSKSSGTYTVDVFVDVRSTSAQTPDGARTTVGYVVTLDGNSWKVSDVGGSGVLPIK